MKKSKNMAKIALVALIAFGLLWLSFDALRYSVVKNRVVAVVVKPVRPVRPRPIPKPVPKPLPSPKPAPKPMPSPVPKPSPVLPPKPYIPPAPKPCPVPAPIPPKRPFIIVVFLQDDCDIAPVACGIPCGYLVELWPDIEWPVGTDQVPLWQIAPVADW